MRRDHLVIAALFVYAIAMSSSSAHAGGLLKKIFKILLLSLEKIMDLILSKEYTIYHKLAPTELRFSVSDRYDV